jgi:hypothetical protein
MQQAMPHLGTALGKLKRVDMAVAEVVLADAVRVGVNTPIVQSSKRQQHVRRLQLLLPGADDGVDALLPYSRSLLPYSRSLLPYSRSLLTTVWTRLDTPLRHLYAHACVACPGNRRQECTIARQFSYIHIPIHIYISIYIYIP